MHGNLVSKVSFQLVERLLERCRMHGRNLSFPAQLAKLMEGFKSCSASVISWLVYPRRGISFALCFTCEWGCMWSKSEQME